jgi:ribosome-binding protein aMBF1 (putative translation factor)
MSNPINNQDWTTITLQNKEKIMKGMARKIVEKQGDMSSVISNKKIENETENFAIKYIPKELSKEIVNARIILKLSQKDFANKLNMSQSIYNELENGKAIYNVETKKIINKIENVYKIKFLNK